MKKSKVLALAGVTLLAAGFLAACSSSKSSSSSSSTDKTLNYIYEVDPENLNYLISGKASTTDCISRWIDVYLYSS